jgi:nitrogen regulatory protein PII 2
MKDVMAIIRINKMNQTKKALDEAGISSMTATGKVLGRGKGNVDFRILGGAKDGHEEAIAQLGTKGPRMITKRLISVVVPDKLVKKVVDVIIRSNQTGNPGDGKIFILPVLDAFRVRTGESGDLTLDS